MGSVRSRARLLVCFPPWTVRPETCTCPKISGINKSYNMSSSRFASHPQPCPCGNPLSQSRIPLFRNHPSQGFRYASDRLGFSGQPGSPPGAPYNVWSARSHQFRIFPRDELNRHRLCFDCGASSSGSIPSGASTEGSLPLSPVAMASGDGSPSGQETPRAEWSATLDDNDWEYNNAALLQYGFNTDAGELFSNDTPYGFDGGLTFQFQGPGSINLSDRQPQDGTLAINSLAPHLAEYPHSRLCMCIL